jgi:hypothetical protein
MLECPWEMADDRIKTAQMVLSCSKVKEVLEALHGVPSGGQLCFNRTLDKVSDITGHT